MFSKQDLLSAHDECPVDIPLHAWRDGEYGQGGMNVREGLPARGVVERRQHDAHVGPHRELDVADELVLEGGNQAASSPDVPRFEGGWVGSGQKVDGASAQDGGFVLRRETQDGCDNWELRLPPTLEISESDSVSKLPYSIVDDVREVVDGFEEVLDVGDSVLQADDLMAFVGLGAWVGGGWLRDTEHVFEDLTVRRQDGAVHPEGGPLGDEHNTAVCVPNVCAGYKVDMSGACLLHRVGFVRRHTDDVPVAHWVV